MNYRLIAPLLGIGKVNPISQGGVIMFEKMLVISEISLNSDGVLKTLKELYNFGTRRCILLHCVNPYESRANKPSYVTDYGDAIIKENLEKQKAVLQEEGFEVETRIVYGYVKKEVVRIADEEGLSLVVAKAEEHSMVGEMFFCGVACDVLYHSNRPILLIRVPDGEPKEPKEVNLFDNVMFPTDFSPNAAIAFGFLKRIASHGLKKVTLVHIQDQAKIDPHILYKLEEFNEVDEKRLQSLKNELLELGVKEVEIQLMYGSPTTKIMELIEDKDISLVVMGRQGKGYIKEIFLGSLSNNLARHASCSMLLIPSKRD